MRKRGFILGIFLILAIAFLYSSIIVSSQEVSYCCEKTKTGAWCQNAPQSECDTSGELRSTPTSCAAASYCRMGYCIDSNEGTCSENTPEKVCDIEGGVWKDAVNGLPPQCNLGCCLLNDQAAFVTQTRCKRLSKLYGLETNYRRDITNEVECIASATSDVKGACVYEKEFDITCKFVTQKECNDLKGTDNIDDNSTVSFHPGFLCSDESLGTSCGKSEKTTCVEGRDEVYFVDTCGNLANIYDASKVDGGADDTLYWSKVVPIEESCNPNSANTGVQGASCGNCDYFLGSTCKAYSQSQDSSRPKYGDYVCRDLSCDFENEHYQHGETWCYNAKGIGKSLPGSRHFRMLCYNGEVTVEPCSDFRQEICIQSSVNDYKVAACRPNKWQDCFAQVNKLDCENIDARDCKWYPGLEINAPRQEAASDVKAREAFPSTANSQPFTSTTTTTTSGSGITGNAIGDPVDEANLRDKSVGSETGACLPLIAPGFNFWEEGDAQSLCTMANKECVVKYEKKALGGKWKCVENCECLESSWELTQNNMCTAIGDCGNNKNFINVQGYNTGYRIITENEANQNDKTK